MTTTIRIERTELPALAGGLGVRGVSEASTGWPSCWRADPHSVTSRRRNTASDTTHARATATSR